MKSSGTLFACFVFILFPFFVGAQQALPKDYFRSPLDIKHFVSGTFAEPRPDHLHSGIDFATNGRQGASVLAVADGYVSRVKVSAGGYGRVIYITHPNGFVSVYAHLNEFNVVVEDYVHRKQMEKQSFEIELLPDPALFPFKKGDLIGYSGNTGSSSGPHLHFELRREHSERPINPALLGIYATDVLPPMIQKLKVYPEGANSLVNGQHIAAAYSFIQEKSIYKYSFADTVKVTGSCYFGLLVRDYVSSSSNDAGIYSWEMLVDDKSCFNVSLDSFAFDETRMVNDVIDYKDYTASGTRFMMFHKSRGNSLPIYGSALERGSLTFDTKKCVRVTLKTRDYVGNTAELNFVVEGQPEMKDFSREVLTDSTRILAWNQPGHYATSDFVVDLPAYSLLESTDFYYARMTSPVPSYSALHRIGRTSTPLIKPMVLSIKIENVPAQYMDKLVIARVQGTRTLVFSGGDVKEGQIETRAYRFGDYVVVADTTAPTVKPLGFSSHKNINALQALKIVVKDDLSGVKMYRAEVNGKWTVMEYDAKSDLLIIPVDELFLMGKNELKLVVIDARNNITTQEYILIR